MSLSDVVKVNITADTQPMETAGFGVPLIVGYLSPHSSFEGAVRAFGSLSEVKDAGISSAHPIYRAAAALCAQNPRPTEFLVGRLGGKRDVEVKLTANASGPAIPIAVEVAGEKFSIFGGAPSVLAEELGGILTNKLPDATVTLATEDPTVTIKDDEAYRGIHIGVPPRYFSRRDSLPAGLDETEINDALDLIREQNDSWYCLIPAVHDPATLIHLATCINSENRLLICASGETDLLDPASTTDITQTLQNVSRTALVYSHAPSSGVAAAWASAMLPTQPGSRTWNFARLSGMPPTTLSKNDRGTLDAKRCNYYLRRAGINMMATGVLTGGDFVDTRRGLDFLKARMQETVFARLTEPRKIPFTDEGIAVIESDVRSVLQLGVASGLLASDPAPTVSVPAALAVPKKDRQNRHLRTVRFGARLAGAIHMIDIEGYVTV